MSHVCAKEISYLGGARGFHTVLVDIELTNFVVVSFSDSPIYTRYLFIIAVLRS